MTTVRRFVRLTGAANVAEMRTMTFEGAEHLVVPVVALIGNAVVRPMHSTGPEFVPAEELALAPGGWDGRPVMPDHPADGTGSANEPRTLERFRFGQLFGTRFESGRLKTEAWLDVARAERLGGDALRVIERCRAGEPVEVSVGCWVALEQVSGMSPSGVPYEYRWAGVTPDHLAMLPEGVEGACSIEMGCGAPRAAKQSQEVHDGNSEGAHSATAGSGEARTTPAPPAEAPRVLLRAAAQEKQPMNLMQRVLAGLGFRQAAEDEGPSHMELENALWEAIYAEESAVQYLDDVHQESKTFVYVTAPHREPMYWRRSYSLGEDGTVTLADDREQVEPVMRYETVTAAKADGEPESESTDHPAVARAACGCQGKGDGPAASAPNEGESMSTKVKDLVGRLIANAASPFTDDDKAHLEALGEAKLEALDAALQPAEPEPKPEPAAETKAEEPDDSERISKEELADLRAAASAHKRTVAAQKAALVAKLKGAQDAYSEAELQALPIEQLERIAKLAKVDSAPVERDFSGRGLPAIGDSASEASFAPPDTYGLVAAAKAKTAGATREAN